MRYCNGHHHGLQRALYSIATVNDLSLDLLGRLLVSLSAVVVVVDLIIDVLIGELFDGTEHLPLPFAVTAAFLRFDDLIPALAPAPLVASANEGSASLVPPASKRPFFLQT